MIWFVIAFFWMVQGSKGIQERRYDLIGAAIFWLAFAAREIVIERKNSDA